jgi:hypothetical protein
MIYYSLIFVYIKNRDAPGQRIASTKLEYNHVVDLKKEWDKKGTIKNIIVQSLYVFD